MVDAEATRTVFSGLIDRPPLTDALLNRPPFKFLLDVISNTITKTGYLRAQFPADDLNPANLADKTSKCAFLDKLIAIVDDGSLSAVKSAKIVAGKEPESTNLLLIRLAENARQHQGVKAKPEKKSSKSKDGPPKEKIKEEKLPKEKSRERSKEKDSKKKSDDKENRTKSTRSSSKEVKEDKKSSKSRASSKEPKEKKSSKSSSYDTKKKEKKEKKEKERPTRGESPRKSLRAETALNIDEGFSDPMTSPMRDDNQDANFSPAKTDDSGIEVVVEKGKESPRPPPPEERLANRMSTARPQTSMGRPGTAAARPAPPKMKKKQIATIETELTPTVELTAEILDDHSREEVGDEFVVEEVLREEPTVMEAAPVELTAEQGGLVQKMMETKAGLEEGQAMEEEEGNDGEMVKEKAKVEQLQGVLQTVTRTTYPLARLFDFAQEDIESMMRELEKWKAETRNNEAELKDREASGLGEAHKLSTALSQLEDEIRDLKTTLSGVKGRVVANEEAIEALMSGL